MLLQLLSLLLSLSLSLASNLDTRPELILNKHKPCDREPVDLWQEKVIFPSKRQGAKLQESKKFPGCYKIGGVVDVNYPINNDLSVYIEMKHARKDKEGRDEQPEPCQNWDENTGCGGYGSCLYCDTCSSAKERGRKERNETGALLRIRGRKLRCDHQFKLGKNRNVYLHFCLPTKREFIQNAGLDEETFDQLMSSGQGLPLWIFIRIFESKNIAALHRASMVMERNFRQYRQLPSNQKVDRRIFESTPFGSMVHKMKSGYIACHQMYGTVRMPEKR